MRFDKLYGLPLDNATWEQVRDKFVGAVEKVIDGDLKGTQFLAVMTGVLAAGIAGIMSKLSLEEKNNAS